MDVVTLTDLVLAVLAVEAAGLAWWRRKPAQGPSFLALLPNLGAGLCLVLVVRIVAAGGSGVAIGGMLAAAGLCHVVDLVVRLRRPAP